MHLTDAFSVVISILKKYLHVLLYVFWLELIRIVFGVKSFAEVDVTDNVCFLA